MPSDTMPSEQPNPHVWRQSSKKATSASQRAVNVPHVAQPIGNILDDVFQELGLHRQGASFAVKELIHQHCPDSYRGAIKRIELKHVGQQWQVHLWFSHPGLASEFQFVRQTLLERLQQHAPQLGLRITQINVHL
jgi:hypothetical protein